MCARGQQAFVATVECVALQRLVALMDNALRRATASALALRDDELVRVLCGVHVGDFVLFVPPALLQQYAALLRIDTTVGDTDGIGALQQAVAEELLCGGTAQFLVLLDPLARESVSLALTGTAACPVDALVCVIFGFVATDADGNEVFGLARTRPRSGHRHHHKQDRDRSRHHHHRHHNRRHRHRHHHHRSSSGSGSGSETEDAAKSPQLVVGESPSLLPLLPPLSAAASPTQAASQQSPPASADTSLSERSSAASTDTSSSAASSASCTESASSSSESSRSSSPASYRSPSPRSHSHHHRRHHHHHHHRRHHSQQQQQQQHQLEIGNKKKRTRVAPPQVPGEGPPGYYDEEGRWHHPPFEGIARNTYTFATLNDNFNMSDLLDFCREYGVVPHPKKKRVLIKYIMQRVQDHLNKTGQPLQPRSKHGSEDEEEDEDEDEDEEEEDEEGEGDEYTDAFAEGDEEYEYEDSTLIVGENSSDDMVAPQPLVSVHLEAKYKGDSSNGKTR